MESLSAGQTQDQVSETWHVRYSLNGVEEVARVKTPEDAIKIACELLDEGHQVFGIGFGSLSASIDQEQVAEIYAMWVRERRVFGLEIEANSR